MDGGRHDAAGESENISRTLYRDAADVTRICATARCGFVVSGEGEAIRFCDAPAPRGRSYCARHHALCQVRPGTKAADAIVAELASAAERAPPPGIAVDPVPEPIDEGEADDALAALDLKRREAAAQGAA